MKCLVTGSEGFIGSHLCERLIADKHEVIGVDIKQGKDVRDLSSIKGVDWIFHLAAVADIVPSIEEPYFYHGNNVNGTVHLLELARMFKVKKFIYAASSSCYGIPDQYPTKEDAPCRPMYPYALTKYVGEQYVLHWASVYKLPAISLRLFNVYGPRHRTSGAYGAVFGVFLSQLANNKPLTIVGDGTQSRDFTYVTDVVDALVKAAESPYRGLVMNVGSGGHYSINHLADLLGPTTLVHVPKRPGEPEITFADTKFIKDMLSWSPKVSFEEGVKIMKGLVHEYKEAPLWTPETISEATKLWFETLS